MGLMLVILFINGRLGVIPCYLFLGEVLNTPTVVAIPNYVLFDLYKI